MPLGDVTTWPVVTQSQANANKAPQKKNASDWDSFCLYVWSTLNNTTLLLPVSL